MNRIGDRLTGVLLVSGEFDLDLYVLSELLEDTGGLWEKRKLKSCMIFLFVSTHSLDYLSDAYKASWELHFIRRNKRDLTRVPPRFAIVFI